MNHPFYPWLVVVGKHACWPYVIFLDSHLKTLAYFGGKEYATPLSLSLSLLRTIVFFSLDRANMFARLAMALC
jgi:hypothetical protein